MSARFEKGGRGTKKTKPEPARTSLGFLEMRHAENTGWKRATEEEGGKRKRGRAAMRGTVRRSEGKKGGRREAKEEKRERQICRMTTMTMTRRSRRFHFLYRDRDVRELQKKRI